MGMKICKNFMLLSNSLKKFLGAFFFKFVKGFDTFFDLIEIVICHIRPFLDLRSQTRTKQLKKHIW
jgi:hypothetical protein